MFLIRGITFPFKTLLDLRIICDLHKQSLGTQKCFFLLLLLYNVFFIVTPVVRYQSFPWFSSTGPFTNHIIAWLRSVVPPTVMTVGFMADPPRQSTFSGPQITSPVWLSVRPRSHLIFPCRCALASRLQPTERQHVSTGLSSILCVLQPTHASPAGKP